MHAQLNRFPRRLAAVLAVTALSLGAAACSSSSDSSGAKGPGTDGKKAANAGQSSTAASTGGKKSNSSSSAGDSSGSNSSASTSGTSDKGSTAGGSGSTRCHTAGLKAAFAAGGDAVPDMKSDKQTQASVALTNTGSRNCTLTGFPGVDLIGNQADDGTWSLPRSSKPVTTITLAPGATTDFTITLGATTQTGSGTFEPGLVRITPPNEKTQFSLKWPFGGAVIQQDGATHPATFVNPIGS
ncbi:DUF4232 domain-containing protein [Streptomyces sp. NPDC051322]|uniref:DUF4232 domain-containing protein n=1 Tax=Streptomyces sp. NPDC051322 TaxID=3154645 RepID=UPI00344E08A4